MNGIKASALFSSDPLNSLCFLIHSFQFISVHFRSFQFISIHFRSFQPSISAHSSPAQSIPFHFNPFQTVQSIHLQSIPIYFKPFQSSFCQHLLEENSFLNFNSFYLSSSLVWFLYFMHFHSHLEYFIFLFFFWYDALQIFFHFLVELKMTIQSIFSSFNFESIFRLK